MNFRDEQHKNFYLKHTKHLSGDMERKALFYTLGLIPDIDYHIKDLYDFHRNVIKPDGLKRDWQTSTSKALTRLAFDLYGFCPTVPYDCDEYSACEVDDILYEAKKFSVRNVFCNEANAPYMWEAVKIRFEYA